MKPKILLITYYWPPSGGPGVQRWLKFCKYLVEQNVEVTVYVPENPAYPVIDKNFKTPKGITVLKQKITEPAQWFQGKPKKQIQHLGQGHITHKNKSFFQKLAIWLRGNLFIPDSRIFWIKSSISFLNTYLKNNSFDTVITTGPPHSIHLIGKGIKDKNNIQWIADFRDPWTKIFYHKDLNLSTYAQKKHEKLERKVLKSANKIITTSWQTKEEFQNLCITPIQVITNGFDSDDFKNITFSKKTEKILTITHIGSIVSDRIPIKLIEILAHLKNDYNFKLEFVGSVCKELKSILKEKELLEFVHFRGYLSHKEAIKIGLQSDLLLLLGHKDEEQKGIIHGKIFEYLYMKKPILVIGPPKSDMKKIIEQTISGIFVTYNETKNISSFLTAILNQSYVFEPKNCKQFHRKELTKQLIQFIEL